MLLIDDNLQSGKTLKFTRVPKLPRGPSSVPIPVLLAQTTRRQTEPAAAVGGSECPAYFPVSYGLYVAPAVHEVPFVGIVRGDA